MKITLNVGDAVLTAEAGTQQELMGQLGDLQVLAKGLVCPVTRSGKPSTNVHFNVREVDGNKFYEARCQEPPYATLRFGTTKKGNKLFVKLKDKSGNYLPDNGWTVYQNEEVEV
jgi:hypothetical protein